MRIFVRRGWFGGLFDRSLREIEIKKGCPDLRVRLSAWPMRNLFVLSAAGFLGLRDYFSGN